jgi:hypothetical protein
MNCETAPVCMRDVMVSHFPGDYSTSRRYFRSGNFFSSNDKDTIVLGCRLFALRTLNGEFRCLTKIVYMINLNSMERVVPDRSEITVGSSDNLVFTINTLQLNLLLFPINISRYEFRFP